MKLTPKFYSLEQCQRKVGQHRDMAGLARQDRDMIDAAKHDKLAREWQMRAREGGYTGYL